jgi:hypothetical protein
MSLNALNSLLEKKGLKADFRQKQRMLSSRFPLENAVDREFAPEPVQSQLPQLQIGGFADPTPASTTRVAMPPMPSQKMIEQGVRRQDNERRAQEFLSRYPNAGYSGTVPSQGTIDYPHTDRRSQNYSGNPNMAFARVGKTGEVGKMAEDNFNIETLGALTPMTGRGYRAAKTSIEASQDAGVLSKAFNYNPLRFKVSEDNWYRQVGKSAIEDAINTRLIREAGEEVSPRMFQEFQNQLLKMQGHGMEAALARRRPTSPFFSKGELFYPMNRKPIITKTGKISKNPAGKGSADYLIETSLPNESFQPAYVKGMSLGVPTEIGETAILKPDPALRNLDKFNLYKKHWWKGYKKFAPESVQSQLPQLQTGGPADPIPTRADSLFLLNNNKIIQDLLNKGYEWIGNVPISDPPFNSKEEAIEAVKKIYAVDTDKSKGISRKGSLQDYLDVKGEMVGSPDWKPGGGDDKGLPVQYVHPKIAPQFKGDLYSPATERPSVFSYGYEDLAITPWDMLTPAQKADRRMIYGDAGTPFDTTVIPASVQTTAPTTAPTAAPKPPRPSYKTVPTIPARLRYDTEPERAPLSTRPVKGAYRPLASVTRNTASAQGVQGIPWGRGWDTEQSKWIDIPAETD